MKQSTYYFSHDYNAANDVKILFIREKFGMQGYGVYWYIIESLAQSNGVLPINIIPVLAMQMQVDKEIVKSIITDFDLFSLNENNFSSERLRKHLELRNTLKQKGKEGANIRWGNRGGISGGNAKEIKGNENISIDKIVIR